jgi:hypothetical protein
MKKLLGTLGMFVGSTIGWFAAAKIGFMTAFIVSTIGGGVGAYYGVKAGKNLLG